MAQVLSGNKLKLNDGKTVTAQEGGWYDGQQFFGGTLSQAGVINSNSNQIGAGQKVSSEVNRQSDQAQGLKPGTIDAYVAQQNKTAVPTGGGASFSGGVPTSSTSGGGTGLGGAGFSVAPAIDLAQQYKSLYQSSGIQDLEAKLAEQDRAFTEAKGTNSDNPFLDEASRVGREAKLQTLYDDRTKNARDEIATKKADVETQLNLALKQFDINSQQAQQALSQFNTLLSMGALDNASGEDIANITRSTGISSEMIKSAIGAKNKEKIETSLVTSTNDAGVVTATVINTQTGEVISSKSLGAIGNAQNGGGSTTPEKNVKAQFINDSTSLSGAEVGVFSQLVAKYAPYMSLDEIYTNYLNTSIGKAYGTPKESPAEIKEVYDYYKGE